jgi:hypothetical protein
MFQRLINDFKDRTGTAMRLTSLVAATALALLITISFLCAAGFVFVLQRYGLIEACLAGAVLFFIVAAIMAICYIVARNRAEARTSDRTKSVVQTTLADPRVVAAGLQLIRSVGVKKLIPILAVGGLALGLLAGRNASSDQSPAE